jgi:zinc protease
MAWFMILRSIALIAFLLLLPASTRAAVFDPTSFTLANGLQIVVVPNHLAPVVNQMVWYKVGSSDELKHEMGLAHYLEHLMFRGTTTMGPGDFSKTIAAHGGNDNAFTSYDYTAFYETVAVDQLPMVMQMEADRMQNLNITPDTAVPELSVVLDERQERTDNNPEGKFTEKLRHMLLPEHPYGIPVIGWKHKIEKLTPADAQAFYQHHYAPNNAIVIITGDVTPEKVMRLAASTYGILPRMDVMARKPVPPSPVPSKHELVMEDIGVNHPQLVWEAMVPSYSTQKKHEAYAYEILAEALDSGEVGLLYNKLAREQGLASLVEAEYDPDSRGDATFIIGLSPNPGKDPRTLQKALQDELQALAQTGLDTKTIDDAKRRLERSAIFARDSLIVPGYDFGMALTTGHAVADVEAWPERIEAVTAEDVNAALHDLVASPRNVTGLLLPDTQASRAAREAAQPIINHEMGIR